MQERKPHRLRVQIGRIALVLAMAVTLQEANSALAQDRPIPTAPPGQSEAPTGAPNVVVVLLDDVGFAASATFGGPVATPNLDMLAREGLRYNRFHTTGMCSPTRASLLTGRNPHAVGMGTLTNSADSRPGYNSVIPRDAGTIAEVLRRNGYNTAAFGKWHLTPSWETSQSGPFDRWPTGMGFEKFYGFMDGETDQYEPSLVEGTTPRLRPSGKGYHLTEDLVNRSIEWIRSQHAVTPEKPFFLYLSTGAPHAPLQVPSEWIARYRGKFDQGWDSIRSEILARQKALGVIPGNTELTPRPDGLPAWDSLAPAQRRLASRYMEVYAGFLAHADAQIGRLVTALKESGQFENTLFMYVVGDNGASADGGLNGSISYTGAVQGLPEDPAATLRRIDEIGGPTTFPHMPSAWAWALNTPFQWTKKIGSHLGGTRNPLIITWPKVITQPGGLRSQFGHVNDIMPTILEAARIPAPEVLDGVRQRKLDGSSLLYSFNSATAPERHTTQYFELYGHRAIYHNGWMASAFHTLLPWHRSLPDRPFEADKWELYDLRTDFSQARDLASREPRRVAELKAVFEREATANRVLPLGVNFLGANAPKLNRNRTHFTYFPGTHIPESQAPAIANRSWSVSAQVTLNSGNGQGVIAAFGNSQAGWTLYLNENRRPVFAYRTFTVDALELVGTQPLVESKNTIRIDFNYAGGGRGKGATARMFVNDRLVSEAGISATSPGLFALSESLDVGIDMGSPVGKYPPDAALGYPFRGGEVERVEIILR